MRRYNPIVGMNRRKKWNNKEVRMTVVTASSKGQIVIPKDIRKKLKIVPGKKLVIKSEGTHVLITPLPDDPVESFCGIFEEGVSLTKALMSEKKKEKDREEKNTAG
jgi:AbrB family looped-hinge helix DNA binding protein